MRAIGYMVVDHWMVTRGAPGARNCSYGGTRTRTPEEEHRDGPGFRLSSSASSGAGFAGRIHVCSASYARARSIGARAPSKGRSGRRQRVTSRSPALYRAPDGTVSVAGDSTYPWVLRLPPAAGFDAGAQAHHDAMYLSRGIRLVGLPYRAVAVGDNVYIASGDNRWPLVHGMVLHRDPNVTMAEMAARALGGTT